MTHNDLKFHALTVVICATDEETDLKKTVTALMNLRGDIGEIVIVRPDWATDGCVRTTAELIGKYPDTVREIVQARQNLGGAVMDGIDSARYDHILFMPADLAIGLDVLPKMIGLAKQHPGDVIKVSRWIRGGGWNGSPRTHVVLNALGQIFLQALFCSGITDHTNAIQIMPTDLCLAINWKANRFSVAEEMVLVPIRLGIEIREVPAVCYERMEGKSKNSKKQLAVYLKTALSLRFTPRKNLMVPGAEVNCRKK